MTKSVRATTCSPKVSQGVHAFSFRFRLRSLFFVTAVCAILSALYAYFGNAVILPLLLGAAACLAVIFIIDTSLAIRDIFIGILRRRSFRDEQDRGGAPAS